MLARLLSTFKREAGNRFNDEIVEFIGKYENYINYMIYHKDFHEDDKADCRQYVIIALIKSYKNRYKYTSWSELVKTIIERKAIDFQRQLYINRAKITTESTLNKHKTAEDEFDYYDVFGKYVDNRCEVVDFIRELEKIISSEYSKEFTEWEIALVEKLVHYVGSDVFNIVAILNDDELIGLAEPKSTNRLFVGFVGKLKELGIGKILGV